MDQVTVLQLQDQNPSGPSRQLGPPVIPVPVVQPAFGAAGHVGGIGLSLGEGSTMPNPVPTPRMLAVLSSVLGRTGGPP